jgi:hypothetical protein
VEKCTCIYITGQWNASLGLVNGSPSLVNCPTANSNGSPSLVNGPTAISNGSQSLGVGRMLPGVYAARLGTVCVAWCGCCLACVFPGVCLCTRSLCTYVPDLCVSWRVPMYQIVFPGVYLCTRSLLPLILDFVDTFVGLF